MLASLYARHTLRQLLAPYGVEDSRIASELSARGALIRSGIRTVLVRLGVRQVACIAGVTVGISAVLSPLYGCAAGLVLLLFFRGAQKRREGARNAALERELPTLLTSVASSVRAGIDPLVAVAAGKDFFPEGSAMQRELVSFAQALSSGKDEYEVIDEFMKGVPSPEGDLFKRCLTMSRRHGASLAEPLHRITKVIRQRHSFRRKTKAALAMHRLSAFGIAFCAAAIGVIQFVTNASAVQGAMKDSVGRILLSVGVGLIALGVFWMTRMGREERL
jgi:tight adherence protein B